MVNRKWFRKLAVGTPVLALLLSCGGPKGLEERAVLRRGLSGEPSTLDPAAVADNFSGDLVRDLYEGLTAQSPTGEVIPGVAASWTNDATGTVYTFNLRPGARWSNGDSVTARDFLVAMRRAVDPRQGSPAADNLRLIAGAAGILAGKASPDSLGVSAPSPRVLQINLVAPAPYFPQLLSNTVMFPVLVAQAEKHSDAANWVSNGAYVLEKWSPGAMIRLKRNEFYWDKQHVLIPHVEYQFSADDASQFARYRSGELDLTDAIPASAIPSMRATHPPELMTAPFLATAYYGLNLSQGPLAKSVQLRQALTMAIDRRRLVELLGSVQTPAYGFLPPGVWNYTPQTYSWGLWSDEARIAEAKRLYLEAGFSRGSPLKLRLLLNSNPLTRQLAVLVTSMWKETLGIDTELTSEEFRVFLQTRHDKSRWDVVRLSWTADFNDASNFLDIFRQASVNNDEAYSNPVVDRLLLDAEQSADPANRRTLLEKTESTVLNDYPIIPLYFLASKHLVKPYVLGLHPTPLNVAPSATLRFASDRAGEN